MTAGPLSRRPEQCAVDLENACPSSAEQTASSDRARSAGPPGRILLWTVRSLTLAAAATLGAGLTGPCMTIIPSLGDLDFWVRLLRPDMGRPTTYSMLGGIIEILRHDNWWIGVVLLLFSCIFPTVKLAIMAWAAAMLAARRRSGRLMQFAHHTGKFSMLDVLVIALVIIAFKGLPGRTRIQLHWGVAMFAASVVLSLLISVAVHYLEAAIARAAAAEERPPAQ